MIVFAIVMVGCTAPTKTVYVDRVIKQSVEVVKPCDVDTPKCLTRDGTYTEVIEDMDFCIHDLKEALNYCTRGKDDN